MSERKTNPVPIEPAAGVVRISHWAEVAGIYHLHDIASALKLVTSAAIPCRAKDSSSGEARFLRTRLEHYFIKHHMMKKK